MSKEIKETQALELKAQEVPLGQQDLQGKVVLAVLGHLALLDQGVPPATWEYLDHRVLLASLDIVTPPHAQLTALECPIQINPSSHRSRTSRRPWICGVQASDDLRRHWESRASPLLELHLANVVTWFVLYFAEGGRVGVMGSISYVAKSILLFPEIVFLNHLFL